MEISAAALGAGLALFTAVIQLLLKKTSRVPQPGQKLAKLNRDDYLFWTDWTVAGSLALAILLVTTSLEDRPASPLQTTLALLYVFLGYLVLPLVAKVLLYDGSGNFHPEPWRAFAVNFFAYVVLVLAITVGAKVYG